MPSVETNKKSWNCHRERHTRTYRQKHTFTQLTYINTGHFTAVLLALKATIAAALKAAVGTATYKPELVESFWLIFTLVKMALVE
jgi:hypothetical protein